MTDTPSAPRRRLLRNAVALAAASAVGAGRAQYPTRPVVWIIPAGPGGTADNFARSLQPPAQDALGQPLVLEYRPGAGGVIGLREVARAAPDGYTLVLGSLGPCVIFPLAVPSYGIDALRDFTPITRLADEPGIILGSPDLAAGNLTELIALARAAPQPLQYGTPGISTTNHLIGELLALRTGIRLEHVPYKTITQAYLDLMQGRIPLVVTYVSGVRAQVDAGKVKALAVTRAHRSRVLPSVPTVEESGVRDFDVATWYGVFAPRGTPPAAVERVYRAMTIALRAPDVRARLAETGTEAVGNTPAEFAAEIRRDLSKWAAVIKATHIRMD